MPESIFLPDEAATQALGSSLAECLAAGEQGAVIQLEGDLGTGKTTLVRAILHALGYTGRVVSPSYTLIEPYNAGPRRVYHMDLYRLGDPGELEYLAIRDIDPGRHILLVEWPEHGAGMLPPADLHLRLRDDTSVQSTGRSLECLKTSQRGAVWWQRLQRVFAADHDSVG